MGTVCIYASSSESLPQELYDSCRRFGESAAANGWDLIFGGGNIGLMNATALGFRAGGADVVSVIPRIFEEQGLTFEDSTEVVVTEDLRERKKIMLERSTAVVALPGGPGTLEELLETLTLRQLGFHSKPILIFNFGGHFDGLLNQIEDIVHKGFALREFQEFYTVVETLEGLEQALFTD